VIEVALVDISLLSVLREGLSQYGLTVDPEVQEKFFIYLKEVDWWNKKMNLVGPRSHRDIIVKDFLDSISCREGWDFSQPCRVADIGSGAGFPGLPLKLCYPNFHLTITEASVKKSEFLGHVVKLLKLDRVAILPKRAEEVGRHPKYRGQFDVVLSRAVAPLPILVELCLPFLKVGGRMVAQKSQQAEEEVKSSAQAISMLGGKVVEVKPVVVPFLEAYRALVLIEKIAETPERFPRRPGIPQKRPLSS